MPNGRLKLRQIEGAAAALIWYERPDQVAARTSAYQLVPVREPRLLESVLAAALGARGQVRKRRTIYLWHNIRIHLDEVAGLGTCVEFEAVLSAGEDEAASRPCLEHLSRALGIRPEDHLAPSYAYLLGL